MTCHDGFVEEGSHILPQVPVGSLGIVLRLERHVPAVVAGKLAADESRAFLARKQTLHRLIEKINIINII